MLDLQDFLFSRGFSRGEKEMVGSTSDEAGGGGRLTYRASYEWRFRWSRRQPTAVTKS